ncbi:MAG: hypothetical protein ABH821_05620 [archaeon]
MSKGQLSLELLLVLSAFLSVFLVLTPLIIQAHNLSLYSLDVRNAELFSVRLKEKVEQLQFLENDSSFLIESKIINEWQLESNGKTLALKVKSLELNESKTLSLEFPETIFFSKQSFKERILLRISKNNNKLILIVDS